MTAFAINPPRTPLVDSQGIVTPEWYKFFVQIQRQLGSGESDPFEDSLLFGAAVAIQNQERVPDIWPFHFVEPGTLTAGTALSGGGNMAGNVSLRLADTAVTPDSYGSASEAATFTVDQQGRLTSALNVAITAAAIGAVPTSRILTAGAGLTGGGDLTLDRTFDVGAGSGITVNANDVALDIGSTRNTDHTSVTLTAGSGLTGGGDISANRSFAVGAGTGISVNADDVALADTAVTPGSYGSAISVPSFTVDQQGRLTAASGNTIPSLAFGTYTPTLTNVANLSASAAFSAQYLQVGNTVIVSAAVTVDPTTTATDTQLGISLPVASNFSATTQCVGSAFASAIAGQGAAILGDTANDRATMRWMAGDVTNQPMYMIFAYRIL